ncbi:MAG: N-acetylglucosamine-6-phosphate deacetylase [Clostridiales bacterium]|nr:N-acetylglucosamine-6-phosphate deacetylase [Clostridiales bacterium]
MTVFKNAKLIYPDRIRDGVLTVDNGKIAGIYDRLDAPEGAQVIDCAGRYLSPGFVDIHVHGGGGKSAMSDKPQDITDMCAAHASYGTTSMLPTTLAAPIPQLETALDSIRAAKEKSVDCNILGAHLEGPFLSLKMKGAQSPENILVPAEHDCEALLDYWKGIRIIGAAPETEGALELGLAAKKRGIVASVAHSDATYEQAEKALEYGYSDVTHIYSACSSVIKINLFRIAGVVEAGLVHDDYTVQVIADLRHLPVGLLKLIYKCKGAEKISLITDGLEFSATDMTEGTICSQENGVKAIFEDGVMKLADRSALAGSVATSSRLVRNMYHTAGVPLYDAVRMASATPASVAGFGNAKGRLQVGYDADIILFNENIDVSFVMTNGKVIKNN